MISIYLVGKERIKSSDIPEDALIIYLYKPVEKLLENEFYVDLDALDFPKEELDSFVRKLRVMSGDNEGGDNSNVLLNEEIKYIYIRLYNLTQLIKKLTNSLDFKLHFDKKVFKTPSMTVLLGSNKESPKVFLHDLRDTLYPYVVLYYGKSRCKYQSKLFDFNLYFRTVMIFLVTSVLCFAKIIFSILKKNNVLKYEKQSKYKNECFVFIRSPQQIKFLERIASSSSMKNINFIIFKEFEGCQSFYGTDNLHFRRLSRNTHLLRFIKTFTKSIYLLFLTITSNNSISKNRTLEVISNFEHAFWFDINSYILDNLCQRKIPLISLEMVGRHSRNIQSLCAAKQISLHRFQVASIEPRHVQQISFYGRFWTLDELSYKQLIKRFPNEVVFDNYISPSLNLSSLEYSPKRIVFATQPYGEKDNYKIISSLISVVEPSYQLVIRKHPRDNLDYKVMFPNIEYDLIVDSVESIACSGLVISKTSTILQDCYNLGVPYVAVLFDDYSRTLDLLFTKVKGSSCTDEAGFERLIKAYMINQPHLRSTILSKPNKIEKIKAELLNRST